MSADSPKSPLQNERSQVVTEAELERVNLEPSKLAMGAEATSEAYQGATSAERSPLSTQNDAAQGAPAQPPTAQPPTAQNSARVNLPSPLKSILERGVGVLSATLGEELSAELLEGDLSKLKRTLERRVERGVERGQEALEHREETLKALKQAPQELLDKVGHTVERYRTEGVEVARAELRRFLDQVDLNKELQKLLAQFCVEVKTEIRFAPSEDGGVGVKPIVKTSARVKREPKTSEDESFASPREAQNGTSKAHKRP